MSRILKRPMFRKGGPTNEGVMSMVVPKRAGYQSDGSATTIDNYTIDPNDPVYKDAMKRAAMLLAFAGPGRSQSDRLSSLLIRGGLKTMSQRPRGGLLPTLATAFEQPVDEYLKSGETEDAFRRQIKLTGLTGAISSAEAKELQKMKIDAALADEARKERMLNKELAAKTDPTSFPIYDVLENFRKQGFKPRKITLTVGTGEKIKPAPSAVLSVPEGEIFYDPNNNLYKRVPKEVSSTGYVRIDSSGKEIKVEAPAKKPGFFERSKESGAAYDPRSWTKQRFYEEIGKKNTLSNM